MPSLINKLKKVFKESAYSPWLLKMAATSVIIFTTVYGVNDLLFSLFDTTLGKIFLVILILFIGMNNIYLALFSFVFLLVIYYYYKKHKKLEGFEWSKEDKANFISLQATNTPRNIYNVEKLQEYVSPGELTDYFKTGKWDWSQQTQDAYKDALDKNTYVRMYKDDGLNRAQKIYPEYAMNFILDNQKKNKKINNEPPKREWLPSGWGDFGYNSGLI